MEPTHVKPLIWAPQHLYPLLVGHDHAYAMACVRDMHACMCTADDRVREMLGLSADFERRVVECLTRPAPQLHLVELCLGYLMYMGEEAQVRLCPVDRDFLARVHRLQWGGAVTGSHPVRAVNHDLAAFAWHLKTEYMRDYGPAAVARD